MTTVEPINYNAREAAKALSVSERTLWTETQAGRVPHTKIGGRVLYPVEALRAWMTERAARSLAKTE